MKKNLLLFPLILLLTISAIQLYGDKTDCKNIFAGPAATIDDGELILEQGVKLKNTPDDGSLYTDNLSKNDGECYDTNGNAVTCQGNGSTIPTQDISVDNGDGSDGDKEISSDLTIDSSNIDDYDNVGKFEIDEDVALTLDDVTIHSNDDIIFDDDAKNLTIKGDVVIYADKFELGKNVGINIADDASLIIITSDDVKISESSFIDTNGHPENFLLFTNATIDFDDYTGNKSFEGFFYSNDDFTIGEDVNITGAVVGKKLQIKDDSVVDYDSDAASAIQDNAVCKGVINYKFDAWDTFRDIDDRNISTKIVGQSFDLTIASLNENGDDYQEFNGTVCASVDDNVTKLSFNDDNTSTATFKVTKALKDVRVHIAWAKDSDSDCPLDSEDNDTNSSDNFAVRPDRFDVGDHAAVVKAGTEFNLSIDALEYGDDTPAKDYNETLHTDQNESVKIDYNLSKEGCRIGSLDIDAGGSFQDGEANVTLRYDEVGELNITVREVNGSEFAKVDSDDTDDEDRLIAPFKDTLRFVPHHFKVSATLSDFDTDNNFTYLSKDLKMSAQIDMTITAENEQNQTTQNYIDACYAKDLDINLSYTPVGSNRLTQLLYLIKDANDTNGSVITVDKNATVSFDYNESNFSTRNSRVDENGTTTLTLFFNFDRNASLPVDPFELNVTDINVTDGDADDIGYTQIEGNATFYYGRIRVDNIATKARTIHHRYMIEIFDTDANDPLIEGMKSAGLYWWLNDKEQDFIDGNVTEYHAKSGYALSGGDDTHVSLSNFSTPSKGQVGFDLDYDTDVDHTVRDVVHLDITPWLWYVPQGLGDDYDFSDGSDCTHHPCFEYTLYGQSGAGVRSGEMNGSDFSISNSEKQRSGIKLFR